MASKVPSIDPAKFKDEEFELWSIPAFDEGTPEYALGSAIGSAKKQVNPNDVLLSRIVPHIRRSWVVTANAGNQRRIASGEWIIFRGADVYPDYLRHVLISDPFHVQFMGTVAGVGGSLLRARPEAVKLIKIPLPPLPEQRRIAGILDQADALRRLRRQSLSRLSDLGQAIFYEMFDSYLLSKDSNRLPLRDVVADGTIVTYGIVQAGEECEGGVPYIRTGDIKNGAILTDGLRHTSKEIAQKFERSKVRAGELVMSIRATVGTTAIVPNELDGANLTQGTARISPGKLTNAIYLLYYLRTNAAQRWIERQVKGATFREITLSKLRELEVVLPPLDLQNAFLTNISQVNSNRHLAESILKTSDSLFTSLQHRAFRGEL